MTKLKEIAEKSEGRVIIASLPKREFTEPTDNGQSKKEPQAQEKPKEVKSQDKDQAKPQKNLAQMQADFEKLRNLFSKKTRFETAVIQLKDFGSKLSESGDDIESGDFRLVLSNGYSRDDVKIGNNVVIADCIKFLLARSESAIQSIENEILSV